MALSKIQELIVMQTWRQQQVMIKEENWLTWVHPLSKHAHLKDLILIPKDDKMKIHVCRPYETAVKTEHRLVLCIISPARIPLTPQVKRKASQAEVGASTDVINKLRRLNVPKLALRFRQFSLMSYPEVSKGGWVQKGQCSKLL
jgi:hypothetical protein